MNERAQAFELRADGRRIFGPAMIYGDVSPSHREWFESGSFRLREVTTLNLRHNALQAIAWQPDGGLEIRDTKDALMVSATVPPTPAGNTALRDVASGLLRGLSVEFEPITERREDGLRVHSEAMLNGIGLVQFPSYEQSTVEVRERSGLTLMSSLPANRDADCECSGGLCTRARFLNDALEKMWTRVMDNYQRQAMVAYDTNFQRPLASVAKGTVRGAVARNGDLDIEIDLPDDDYGRGVVAASESVGVVVRPFLNPRTSVGVETVRADGTNVLEYSDPIVRALIVSATDARQGWPDAIISDNRSALVVPQPQPKKRRARWL